jgi:PepSY-associated TM region
MFRSLLLVHRYLGIAIGLLMVMWCLSGVVMMYVSYPALPESARLKRLVPIAWEGCCKIPELLRNDSRPAGSAEIEMLAGRPVLFLHLEQTHPIDLLTGSAIDGVTITQAMRVAEEFSGAANSSAAPRLLGLIDHDQWTISGDLHAARPLYRFALGDAAGTQLYVSGVTGRAVQITTARERFWNWLGAVPHWLYFAELRRHTWLWGQVVIYAALLGCFLTLIGIYLGVRQMAVQPSGRWSPYVGFNLWHHMAGLVFGVFTLSWVASGLLSMNPWGWLEGDSAQAEAARIHGPGVSVAQFVGVLEKIAAVRPAAVSLKTAALNGRLYFIAHDTGGESRLDEAGSAAALGGADIAFISSAATGAAYGAAPELLQQEDNYYFSHHREIAALPIYRLVLASGTRYYFDPVSGMLVAKQDSASRAYRWLHEGLHRLDFTSVLRSRPLWDAVLLVLMAGVTLVCVTGAYLGYRRLRR